jgi:hypothetical protein
VVAEMGLSLLKLGMSEEKYNSYQEMDIFLQPSFQIGLVCVFLLVLIIPFYLSLSVRLITISNWT